MNHQVNNWTRCYWVLILNQLLVLGPIVLLAAAMLHQAYQACEAASLELPGIAELYLLSIGPIGLLLAGLLSIGLSLFAACFRQRFVAVLLTSVSFVSCMVFLCGGLFASIAPLLVAIRNTLPPEQQW